MLKKKMQNQLREPQPCGDCQELHKEWTEAGVKASRATTHRRVKEFCYSCRQRRLTRAKEKKNWTVRPLGRYKCSHLKASFCI